MGKRQHVARSLLGRCRALPLVRALAVACMLAAVSGFSSVARPFAVGRGGFPTRRAKASGARSIVAYEEEDAALTPARLAKVLQTRPETPALPSCLSLEDR